MKWEGGKPEDETRAALLAGESVYSHGDTFHVHLHNGMIFGGCVFEGCTCDLQFDSIDDYFNWLKDK